MSATSLGIEEWKLTTDELGYRTYTVKFKVVCTSSDDGPQIVSNATGLPAIGDYWTHGNDNDPWCWCRPNGDVVPMVTGEPNLHWFVTLTYSNKPYKGRCVTESIGDPLLEPMKVSGSFFTKQEEATIDRFGNPIVNSAWEVIRGPQVEFINSYNRIKIEQNVGDLELDLCDALKDHVNDAPLWGFDTACIRLASFEWEKVYYGTCSYYYKRTFTFEIDRKTWMKFVLDEGTKVLRGKWNTTNGTYEIAPVAYDPTTLITTYADPSNPQHFDRFKDRNGENTRVILNGSGLPANVALSFGSGSSLGTGTLSSGDAGEIGIDYYYQGNLLLLGIPTSF